MRTFLIVAGVYVVLSMFCVPMLARMFGVQEDNQPW